MVVLGISKDGFALFINCSVLPPLPTWQQGSHQREENVYESVQHFLLFNFYESVRHFLFFNFYESGIRQPSLSFWRVREYAKFTEHHNLGKFRRLATVKLDIICFKTISWRLFFLYIIICQVGIGIFWQAVIWGCRYTEETLLGKGWHPGYLLQKLSKNIR